MSSPRPSVATIKLGSAAAKLAMARGDYGLAMRITDATLLLTSDMREAASALAEEATDSAVKAALYKWHEALLDLPTAVARFRK